METKSEIRKSYIQSLALKEYEEFKNSDTAKHIAKKLCAETENANLKADDPSAIIINIHNLIERQTRLFFVAGYMAAAADPDKTEDKYAAEVMAHIFK